MKIMLDAGHYGQYNQSPVVPTYYESEMTWTLTNYLKSELEAYRITVGLTRTDQTKDRAVYLRGQCAKGYDLFLSIHSNACDTESVDRPVMIVNLDGSTTALGRKIGAVVRDVMDTVQAEQITAREWTGRPGVEYYGVLRGAKDVGTPGMIIEHSFHTNKRAATWLSDASNLARLAKAEAACIAEYYGLQKTESEEIKMDNTPDAWAKEAVEWAQKTGLLLGDEKGDLKLHDACTRQEMAVFLHRLSKSK